MLLSRKIALMMFAGRIYRIGELRIEQNFLGGKEIRNESSKNSKYSALWVVLIQLILTLISSALFYLFQDFEAAKAGLIGGISSTLPHLILVYIMFAGKGSQDLKKAHRLFLFGEVVKTVLISTMLAIVVIFIKPKMLPMMLTFALTYLAFWISLMRTMVLKVPKES